MQLINSPFSSQATASCTAGWAKPLLIEISFKQKYYYRLLLNKSGSQTATRQISKEERDWRCEGWEVAKDCKVGVIRVVNVEAGGEGEGGGEQRADKIVDSVEDGPIAVLLDTSVKGVGGGAGVTFDWEVAKRVQTYGLPVIVAGGLEPENVRALHKIKIGVIGERKYIGF